MALCHDARSRGEQELFHEARVFRRVHIFLGNKRSACEEYVLERIPGEIME
jgi:hypothetical protein